MAPLSSNSQPFERALRSHALLHAHRIGLSDIPKMDALDGMCQLCDKGAMP
ncbi:MAG: hypothetical protein WB676_06980 [Bryobacteraceae bacterium]